MSVRLSVVDMPMPREHEDARPPAAADLETAALAGDAAAWSVLIERHGRRVVVALLARGVPLERAKEIAQETWLRLMERQREGRLSELTLPGLAIVQAGFLAANERRRDGQAASATAAAALPAPGALPSAEDTVASRQRLDRVARALAACPAGARRVFELCYDNPELGYAEIARRVGLSVQRVKQTVFEVRKRLRAALDEEDPR
jgi:RNA polymerase sigma-70 factor (ECF subfamily)